MIFFPPHVNRLRQVETLLSTHEWTQHYRGYGIVVRASVGDGAHTASFTVIKEGTDGSVEVIVKSGECGAGSRDEQEACRAARKAAHTYVDAEIAS